MSSNFKTNAQRYADSVWIWLILGGILCFVSWKLALILFAFCIGAVIFSVSSTSKAIKFEKAVNNNTNSNQKNNGFSEKIKRNDEIDIIRDYVAEWKEMSEDRKLSIIQTIFNGTVDGYIRGRFIKQSPSDVQNLIDGIKNKAEK